MRYIPAEEIVSRASARIDSYERGEYSIGELLFWLRADLREIGERVPKSEAS